MADAERESMSKKDFKMDNNSILKSRAFKSNTSRPAPGFL